MSVIKFYEISNKNSKEQNTSQKAIKKPHPWLVRCGCKAIVVNPGFEPGSPP